MGTLSALDETRPLNVDPIAQGDDAIRETRLAVKTTFAVEHNLDGTHKLPLGTVRPAPTNGRLFINTGTQRVECYAPEKWLTIPPGTYEWVQQSQIPYVVNFPIPKTVIVFRSNGTMSIAVEPAYPRPLPPKAYYQFVDITKLTISAMQATGQNAFILML